MTITRRVRRALLPLGVFVAVAAFHFTWTGLFPERDPTQDRWATVVGQAPSWLRRYIEVQGYWLGFSYALSLVFAAWAFRRYREDHHCAGRNLAIGGVTLTGVLAVAGCYLLGCYGSPMLPVYLSLFGAAFLPFAKPLVAALTTLSIAGAWWWMVRRRRPAASPAASACSCDESGCGCP